MKSNESRLRKYILRSFAVIFFGFVSSGTFSAERIALVVGISNYPNIGNLNNTTRDAQLISDTLSKLDFEVMQSVDVDLATLQTDIRNFSFRAETAEIALVYFAGHGMEFNGKNFLLPSDITGEDRTEATQKSISLEELLKSVEKARQMRIVILDSCRNDPFAHTSDVKGLNSLGTSVPATGGLAKPNPDRGTLVAFAAKDGQTAADGIGNNSPFATALADNLVTPDLEISLLFRRVRDQVLKGTNNQQEPHTYGSLPGKPFFLAGQTQEVNKLASFDRLVSWSKLQKNQQAQLETLADEGDIRAIKGLAYMKLDAADPGFDPSKAFDMLKKVADTGDPEAKYETGKLYENGIGVEQDIAKALALYNEAAELNYADALNDLGFLYYQGGVGTPRDSRRGLSYFEKAASLRHPEAMYNFAALIDDGIVPDKTLENAASLLYDSLRSGNETVLSELSENPRMFKQDTLRALQSKLRSVDMYSGAIDGQVGPQTKRGLQRAYGILD